MPLKPIFVAGAGLGSIFINLAIVMLGNMRGSGIGVPTMIVALIGLGLSVYGFILIIKGKNEFKQGVLLKWIGIGLAGAVINLLLVAVAIWGMVQ